MTTLIDDLPTLTMPKISLSSTGNGELNDEISGGLEQVIAGMVVPKSIVKGAAALDVSGVRPAAILFFLA